MVKVKINGVENDVQEGEQSFRPVKKLALKYLDFVIMIDCLSLVIVGCAL